MGCMNCCLLLSPSKQGTPSPSNAIEAAKRSAIELDPSAVQAQILQKPLVQECSLLRPGSEEERGSLDQLRILGWLKEPASITGFFKISERADSRLHSGSYHPGSSFEGALLGIF